MSQRVPVRIIGFLLLGAIIAYPLTVAFCFVPKTNVIPARNLVRHQRKLNNDGEALRDVMRCHLTSRNASMLYLCIT